MSKFQKIIIAICLLIIVVLGAAVILMFTTTTEALKINGTFVNISGEYGNEVSFDSLTKIDLDVDATITRNALVVTGAEGKVSGFGTEYELSTAYADNSALYVNSKDSSTGLINLTVKQAHGTNTAVINVFASENNSGNMMLIGPVTDNESLQKALQEQNIPTESKDKVVQEINVSSTFVDVYGEHSEIETSYDKLPHHEVKIDAKIKRNKTGNEYVNGTLDIDGTEYTIQFVNRQHYEETSTKETGTDYLFLGSYDSVHHNIYIEFKNNNYDSMIINVIKGNLGSENEYGKKGYLIGPVKDKDDWTRVLKETHILPEE